MLSLSEGFTLQGTVEETDRGMVTGVFLRRKLVFLGFCFIILYHSRCLQTAVYFFVSMMEVFLGRSTQEFSSFPFGEV